MGRNGESEDSTSAIPLGLRSAQVDVNVTWHGIIVSSSSVPTYGITNPKLGSVEHLFHQFLKCFVNSNRSHRQCFYEKRVHTTGKSLAFRC